MASPPIDRRYQVFVSSTYVDLIKERQQVMDALLKIRCLPAGMELFPASGEEQMAVIKRVIDDCDYYVLIVGARYGSIDDAKISYTEREFDYAVETDVPILAFLHSDPGSIPFDMSEADSEARHRLDLFRNKVRTNRLISHYKDGSELALRVTQSVSAAIISTPRPGWIRGSDVSLLSAEVNDLKLQLQDASQSGSHSNTQFAWGQDEYIVEGTLDYYTLEDVAEYGTRLKREPYPLFSSTEKPTPTSTVAIRIPISWNQILISLGSGLLHGTKDSSLQFELCRIALEALEGNRSIWPSGCGFPFSVHVQRDVGHDVVTQFAAQGMIGSRDTEHEGLIWRLNEAGMKAYAEMKAIRRMRSDPSSDNTPVI